MILFRLRYRPVTVFGPPLLTVTVFWPSLHNVTDRYPTVTIPYPTVPHHTSSYPRFFTAKNVKSGGVKSKRSKFARNTVNILPKSSKDL